MGYLGKTSNYREIIVVYNPTHIMSMVDLLAIDVETLSIDRGYSLEKEFTKLIHMNP